jgi:hypothetical protein
MNIIHFTHKGEGDGIRHRYIKDKIFFVPEVLRGYPLGDLFRLKRLASQKSYFKDVKI